MSKFCNYAVNYVDLAESVAKLAVERDMDRYGKDFNAEYEAELLKFIRMSRSMADFAMKEREELNV